MSVDVGFVPVGGGLYETDGLVEEPPGSGLYAFNEPQSPSPDDELGEFYVHTAAVETYLGTNGYGEDTFAAPVSVVCFADEARKLVRDKTGEQVVSETTLATYPAHAPLFTAGSRVTVNGSESRVIKTKLGDSGALDLPDHIEVALT